MFQLVVNPFMQTQHMHERVKGKWEDILPYSAETEMIG